jgi:tetratricopeptide (TPR) repeat protein
MQKLTQSDRGPGRRTAQALVAAACLLLAACATAPPERAASVLPKPPAHRVHPSPPSDPRAYYHFLRGYDLELSRQYDQALAEYLAALTYAPESFTVLLHTADLYLKNGDVANAVETAELALSRYPGDPGLLHFLSQLYLRQENYPAAEQAYRELIAQDPTDLKPYYLLALAYIRQGRFEDARAAVESAREADRDSPLPDYYMGRIHREEGNQRAALRSFKKAMKRDPHFEAAYLDSADLLETAGKTRQARELYEEVVEDVNPRSAVARDQLIRLYLKEGDLDKVLEQFDAILAYNPQNASVRFRKAVVLSEQGHIDEAIENVQRILTLFPSDIRSMAFLGGLFEQAGRYEEARQTFERILELNPDYDQAQIHLGYVADRLGDVAGRERAVEAVRGMIDRRPDDIALYLFVGWGYARAERFEATVDILQKAVAIDPDHVEAHYSLGAAYYELDRFDDMVREMRWVVDRNPRHADALNFLGYSYIERGENLDESISMIQRALEIQPDNGFFLDSLAWGYYMQGRYRDALKVQRRAMDLAPYEDAVLYDHLGSIYLAMDRRDEARQAWIDALELQPGSEDLKERFRREGFGDPDTIQEILKAKEAPPDATENARRPVVPAPPAP